MVKTLWAVSDLHAAIRKNKDAVNQLLVPPNPRDWLIVAGDVAERTPTVLEILALLNQRYQTVLWVPGNHELFNRKSDLHQGRRKYEQLVVGCRTIGVLTPEDPYPVFAGRTVVPMFTLYDYSWRDPELTAHQALAKARERQIMMTDEFAIAPFVDVPIWCRDRLGYTLKRLSQVEGPTILVNHWPLVRECMSRVAIPELALWSGSRHTQDWPERFRAEAVVYGHLHAPGEMRVHGVKHVEVSLGYPRQWDNDRNPRSLDIRIDEGQWPYAVLMEED